jgi:hypothetical protein
MKLESLQCDSCGCLDDVLSYRFNFGSEMDPSGNGYNIIWEYQDFCDDCLEKYKDEHKLLKQDIQLI